MKKQLAKFAAIAVVFSSLLPSAHADSIPTPKGVSDALWKAYQEVALIDPSKLLFQAKTSTRSPSSNLTQYADANFASSEPKVMKWRAAPYVVASGGPLDWDIKGIKSAIADIAQSCTDMKPQYVTPVVTTTTTYGPRGAMTKSSTWPVGAVIYLQYLPPVSFTKVIPWVTSTTDKTDSVFTYDLTGAFVTSKTLISNIATTQKQRDLIAKKALLQALGLQGVTTNKDSKAFINDPNWDGSLSSLDRQIIAFQCNSKVPTFANAQQVADALNS